MHSPARWVSATLALILFSAPSIGLAKPAKPTKSKSAKVKMEPPVDSAAVAPAAWHAMAEQEVIVEMPDGTTLAGRLVAYDGETATLVDKQGVVRTVKAKKATELRVAPQAESPKVAKRAITYSSDKDRYADLGRKYKEVYPGRFGTGRMVAGGILIGTGVPITLSGLVLLLVPVGEDYYGEPVRGNVAVGATTLVFGLAHLIVGSVLVARGRRLRYEYREWLDVQANRESSRPQFRPYAGRLTGGWSVGFHLRF